MFSRVSSFRFVAVLVAAFLMVTGLQSGASAATSRTLTISASPAVGVVGTAVTFSGKLSRSPKGTLVLIQRKSGTKWIKAGSTRTVNRAGNYAVKLTRPKSVATYYYRATAAKKGNLKAAKSRSVAVAALRRTFVSLSCPDSLSCDAVASKTKTTAGSPITLSGTVLPFVKGTLVTFQRKVGSSWTNVTTTSVLANGTFTKAGIIASTSTTYRASVSRTSQNAPGLSNERPVNVKPLITTTALTDATRLTFYSLALTTYGNQAGTWTASGLPTGLNVNPSTGVISGTPTSNDLGDRNVVIGFKQLSTGLFAASKTLNLKLKQSAGPVITTNSLPNGAVATPYPTTTLTASTNGDPAGTWSVSPALPTGLNFNPTTGVISGTPAIGTDGDTDHVIGFHQTSTNLDAAPKTLTLRIGEGDKPVITTTSLPEGTRLTAYPTTTLTATTTGAPAGTWSVDPALPAGLSLDPATGEIVGTPTSKDDLGDNALTFTFTQTSTAQASSKTLHLVLNEAAAPVISTANLPDGNRLASYSTTLTATGSPAGVWTAAPLPDGLTLDPNTGVISGTPTTVGDTDVVVGFTQTSTEVAATEKTLTLHIGEATPPVISTPTLPNATRYQAYTTQLTVDGNPVGVWTSTALPAGMSFNTTTGVLSGSPRNAGDTSITFGFTQTNSGLAATPKALVFHVAQAPPVITGWCSNSCTVTSTSSTLPDGSPLLGYNVQLQVAPAPVGKWALVSGGPPIGITLKDTGQLSGSTLFPGNYQFTVKFTETSTNLSSQRTFFLKIS